VTESRGQPNQKVFVVYNPKAGREDQADEIRAAMARHFTPPRWIAELYETTGREDVAAICRAACERGASLVIAAGGDGTLVGVANGLVSGPIPLGIIPMGTGNYLARALQVPGSLDEALQVLAGDHAVHQLDALKVGERCFFSNISVGITPEVVRDTRPADKKIFGRLAYVLSTIRHSSLFQLHRYRLKIDGRERLVRASEVLISSTTLLQKPPFLFGPPETLGDGQMEVYVVAARTLTDYAKLAWDLFLRPGKPSRKLSHWTARREVVIEAVRRSPLVQGDGEVIGRTPVSIRMIPRALHVIKPRSAELASPEIKRRSAPEPGQTVSIVRRQSAN
jgi:diacylglycerol kinase (ATP)